MWTRRRFLLTTAASAATLAIPIEVKRALAGEEPDLVLRVTASPDRKPIWSGPETRVLRYRAEVLKGRRDAVRPASSYLGPTLELRRGERVRIHFENRMNEPSIIHWHGMIVPDVADGHPHHAVGPGSEYIYDFTVRNPAGTYLYHPHPHGLTGKQVYYGLAGLLIVRERGELTYGLPAPEHELSLVIQDRRIGRENQFAFKRMMMDDMNGVLGDTVLVNGLPDAAFKVSPRSYRLRLANVSNARIYKLAWSDGRPMRVIATDNGLLSSAEGTQTRPYVVLAPFERVELLEDFGERRAGAEVALVSQAFSGLEMMDGMMDGMMGGGSGGMSGGMMGRDMGGMMGGMMGRGMGGMMGGMMRGMMGSGQGEELLVARFTVSTEARVRSEALRLPEPTSDVREGKHAIYTQLAFRHMRGFFNGRRFEMGVVADDERLPLNEGTVWTFSNDGPGMPMPHPIHIHGVRFRILERSGGNIPEDLREGLIDAGYKDTFLIFPDERVRVLVAPTEPGLFMYHCHNLEHEDGGMMRNCLFGSDATGKG
ncbi:multicopper oxidase family protein [Pelomicrobium sp.]|jgi:bilirubin oxidase|uniref:multicopper oxidase family protein n=1 Tax=unclassified Pelomicrobium TaxID=2815318 RepID=UPI0021DBF147|nr:MAG: bilirubin oxidase [Burkholderiales bacterium]